MPPDTLPDSAALELLKVSKFYGDIPALKEVSLRVGAGEAVLLYGPNGAGKTTLLRLLATLGRPTEGQVLLGGRDVHRDLAAKAALGFVSHTTFLYGDLTAQENLRFTGKLFGLPLLEEKIDAALELFNLREWARVPVRELSRGFQQRVTLARAFLHDPRFLLLDEPFTGLDAGSTEKLQALLLRVTERGKGLIFSNHDFDQGAALARRLVALEAGRVVYDGPLKLAPLKALEVAGKQA